LYLCICLHYAKIYSDIDDVHKSHRHANFDLKNHDSVNKLMVRSIKAAISCAVYIASMFAHSHIAAVRHVFLIYKKKVAKVGSKKRVKFMIMEYESCNCTCRWVIAGPNPSV